MQKMTKVKIWYKRNFFDMWHMHEKAFFGLLSRISTLFYLLALIYLGVNIKCKAQKNQ